MRIFVTGGSGFIGKHLLEVFTEHDLLVLSRHVPKREVVGSVKWIKGEIADPGGWEEELIQFDPKVCINLAWEGLPSYTQENSEKNIYLTELLIQSLRKTNIQRLVVAGSCWEYGNSSGQLSETTVQTPESHFAKAKLEVHQKFADYCNSVEASLIWARIFFSYGSGQRKTSLLPTIFDALKRGETPLIKSPEVIQDFIHISDVASALSLLIEADGVSGDFNIGSGIATSVAEFVNIASESCDSNFRLELPETLKGFWASIDKIKEVTSWSPKVLLKDGVTKTLKQLEMSHSE